MNQNELDPQAYNLARAIRRAETEGSKDPYNQKGASGEFGAYQFMPTTYKNLAKKYLGDENARPTVENQNKLAYSEIKRLKDEGKTPAQIASIWNSGKADSYKTATTGVNSKGVKYDVPAYVAKVSQHYNEFKGASQPTPSTPEAPKSNVMFPSNPNDTGLQAGLKALGNTPQSLFNFAKGAVETFNPVSAAKNIGEIGSGFSELKQDRGTGGAIWDIIKGLPKAAYETLVPQGVRSLLKGDIENASKQFTEDPFGQTAPVVLTAMGGAKIADNVASKNAMAKYVEQPYTQKTIPKPTTRYSDAIDTGISKTAQLVTKPVGAVLSLPKKVIKSATSQLIGLEPESITQILSNPKEFSKLAQDQATRGNLASEFGKSIEKVEEALQDTGEKYNPIRQSKDVVEVPKDFISSVLDSFGLKLKNGKVTADTNSVTRNISDVKAIQTFVKNWGKKKSVTANEFLNLRTDLADLANYDKLTGQGKTNKSQVIADKLRQKANEIIRPKIKGLKELDDQFSPQKDQFKQIKKDFLQKDSSGEYVFKEGALNKIANAANKGKDALLARMEEVHPGITKKIQILRTVEDIQKAYGNKVGTYARGVLGGGALITGNVAAIVAAIISNPAIAVPLLRALGYTAKTIAPIINTLKMIGGDIKSSGSQDKKLIDLIEQAKYPKSEMTLPEPPRKPIQDYRSVNSAMTARREEATIK